jgi:hypothetical protein
MRLRLPGVLLLLVALGAVPGWAQAPTPEGYRVSRGEGMDGVPAKLLGPDGKVVASFDTLYADHYHPFEVRPGRVFWVSRPAQLSEGWTDELRVTELSGGKTRTLFRKPGLDFRTDAQGRTAAVVGCGEEGACTLFLVDVASGGERTAHASPKDALAPLGLSRDGGRVWFGQADGPAGQWEQLGLHENGKTRFFPVRQADTPVIDFDTGRVAVTRKKGGPVLVVEDLLGGQRKEVARKKRGAFNPVWNADGSLTYVDAQGKKAQYVPAAGKGAP